MEELLLVQKKKLMAIQSINTMLPILLHCKLPNLRLSFKIGLLMCIIHDCVFGQL